MFDDASNLKTRRDLSEVLQYMLEEGSRKNAFSIVNCWQHYKIDKFIADLNN